VSRVSCLLVYSIAKLGDNLGQFFGNISDLIGGGAATQAEAEGATGIDGSAADGF
jgi:hypothetical protein